MRKWVMWGLERVGNTEKKYERKRECRDGKSEGMMEKCNGNHYWVGYL